MIRAGIATTLGFLGVLVLQACAGWSSWERQRPPETPAAEVVPDRIRGPQEYVVRRGDTVYAIAFRNNLDVRALARWNGIGSDYLIRPGQVLRLKPPRPVTEVPRQQIGEMQTRPIDDTDTAQAVAVNADTPTPAVAPPAAAIPETPLGGYAWVWPARAPVVRGFGQQNNKGLDFGGAEGQPVFAAAPGRVVYSGNALKGYGELIILKHDEVFLSAYGYNRKRLVKEGDVVRAGQAIGEMGVGPENKPLLHFEIRDKGQPINPAGKLPPRTAAGSAP